MLPVYTADVLTSKSINELRAIARQVGVSSFSGKLSRKDTFVNAIISHQEAAVELVKAIVEEVVVEHETEQAQAAEDCTTKVSRNFAAEEAAIIQQIDIISDAINFAILSDSYNPKCPGLAKLEEDQDALNQQLAEVVAIHKALSDAEWDVLDREISEVLADLAPIPPSVWWYDKYNGTVTIDGENRQFKAMAIYSQQPVIKLFSVAGKWIDSRWKDVALSNRYIAAVLADIPHYLEELDRQHKKFIDRGSDGEIWDGFDFIECGDPTGEGPVNRGDGRGRIAPVGEWI